MRTMLSQRNWTAVAGLISFIAMMSVRYDSNVTFVQLGLKDLGERVLGLDAGRVVLEMTVLTWLAPHLASETAFLVWIVATAVALGVGVPVTFGMTVDLVPVRDRGWVGGDRPDPESGGPGALAASRA